MIDKDYMKGKEKGRKQGDSFVWNEEIHSKDKIRYLNQIMK